MGNRIRQSVYNPVNFYQLNPQQVDQYVSRHMDYNPYLETLEPWQQQKAYAQPWQNNDSISLQFESNYGPLVIKVIDGWEQVYNTIPVTQLQQNANDPDYHIYEVVIPLAPYARGDYYLRLEGGTAAGGGPVESFISEPLNILAIQKETLLLSYRNYQFKGNTIFETGFAPNIRFKGRLSLESLAAKDTFFEDDELSQRLVDGKPFETYELTIGYTGSTGITGIPDWYAKKISRIFSLSDTYLDGKRFTKAGSDGLQPVDIKGYPLRAWTLKLRDTENKDYVTYENNAVNLGPESFILSVDNKAFGSSSGETQIIDVQ